ncbi:transglutaminaseTgpA domain-containing protein [Phytoactinopolyspora limicola]|uniref:transglutaminase family protein n=1 Tax=Phytoactinopolyspora limicola TaxID=2715536 RepID=UPI00140B83ED|nr:transglutaminase domain-containing protein [Phytoactinopolyspora limicola]
MRFAWAALVLLTASLTLAPAYQGWAALPALALAVLIPLGLVMAGRALKLPRWLVAAAASGLCTAVALAVLRAAHDPAVVTELPAWRDSPGLSLLGPLIDAVPTLLTSPRPAPAVAELLAPTGLLVALVALTVFLLVDRGHRLGVAPVAGAALVYVAGALLTAGEADRYGVVAVAVVVLAGAGWILLDRPDARSRAARAALRRSPGRRAAALAGIGALVVSASAALVAAALPGDDAFEPREHVAPPVVDVAATSPLPLLGWWEEQVDLELFRVGGTPPAQLALVAMPDFDGARWRVDARFQPLGSVGRADLPPGRHNEDYDIVVEIAELDGNWLPAAGLPSASSLDDVYVDPDTGSVVRPAGLHTGLRYTVRGTADRAPVGAQRRAGVPAVVPQRYLDVPRLPDSFAEYAASGVEHATTRREQALALEELVRVGRTLDPVAPVGSSYARLEDFLFGDDDLPGAQRGTSEQFATAFVVMARSLGIPSRLVVGFDVPPPDADGVSVIMGRHAKAWPEVYLSGAGWVAFDPTPSERDLGDGDRQILTGEDEIPEDDGPDDPANSPEPTAEPQAADRDDEDTAAGPAIGVLAGTAGLLVAAAAALIVGLRLRRRLRHRRTGAVGAWQETLDAWWLAGQRPVPNLPAPGLAGALAQDAPGRVGAGLLAELAERAAFAPRAEPARSGRRAGGGTSEPWLLASAVSRDLRRGAGLTRRLLWWVDPRLLRRP